MFLLFQRLSAATTSQSVEVPTFEEVKMDILYRPSILNKFYYWKVFDDDAQVEIFMKNNGEFIDNKVSWKNMSEVCELIDLLKSNKILKGLVPLEWIFDRHDMYKHKVGENKPKEYIEINIGSEVGPKIIKIEKGLQRKKGKKNRIFDQGVLGCV